MSVILALYTTKDKPNTINKTLTLVKSITGQAIEPINIMNPVVKIKVVGNSAVLACNYARIAVFNRYYFIKNIVIEAGFMRLELDVDVLESHKADILAYKGILARQEKLYNLYLEDSEISAYTTPKIAVKKFPNNPFDVTIAAGDKRFVLITTSN